MYRKNAQGWKKYIDFMIIDMLSLEISFFLAYLIRHGFQNSPLQQKSYLAMVFVLVLIDYVSTILLHTYDDVLHRGLYLEAARTLRQAVLITLLSTFYLFTIQEGGNYSRITLFLTGVIYFFFSIITRLTWRKRLLSRKNPKNASMILITTTEEAADLISHLNNDIYKNVTITGIVLTDVSRIGEKAEGIEIVADRDTAEDYMRRGWVDEAFFGMTVDEKTRAQLQKASLEMGITVHQTLFCDSDSIMAERTILYIAGYAVLTRSIRILSGIEVIMKRMLDIIGGIAGCIITGFLILIIGPFIYMASPGPIFFTQERIGKNGKVFKMYKFRSMYLDAEERKKELLEQNRVKDGYMFKLDYDPRIIGSEKGKDKGIGNFIRRTSIDEFPQFFNVLKGDMSLVGTRPPTKDEWKIYQNHHRARMATKPGITGMWQVSGRSNITDFEDVVDLDMQYIENCSLGLDMKIIGKTIVQIFRGEGAA